MPQSKSTLRPAGVPLKGNIETSLNKGGNYPEEDVDSTSSGGYGNGGADVWSHRVQRGIDVNNDEIRRRELPSHEERSAARSGAKQDTDSISLVDQSLSGGDLEHEMQDANQGHDGGWPSGTGAN